MKAAEIPMTQAVRMLRAAGLTPAALQQVVTVIPVKVGIPASRG